MLRSNRFVWVLALVVGTSFAACGGGAPKKETKKTIAKKTTKKKTTSPVKKKKVTEEDRAKKREDAANELVASGSTCLPPALKDPASKMSLELGALGKEPILCAMDHDPDRLLGAAGCWTINLTAGGLSFRDRNGVPGRGYSAAIDGHCVRGYCMPKDQEVGASGMIAWSIDTKQVAVLAGEQVHLFDAETKELSKSINLRDPALGDKAIPGAPTGMWFLRDALFLQGGEGNASSIWMYKADGSTTGQMMGLGKGNPPVALAFGSFSVLEGTLDKERVAVAERGFSTLTIFEVGTGKRSKLVRKINKGPCRTAEMEKYFSDSPGELPGKCVNHLKRQFDHFLGTTIVAGSKNFLGALTGDRVGELAVIDSKNLSEKRSIKLPWCDGAAAAETPAKAMMTKESAEDSAEGAAAAEDPDAGGQATEASETEEEPVAKPAKKKAKKKSR
jgi:hypothetical protein